MNAGEICRELRRLAAAQMFTPYQQGAMLVAADSIEGAARRLVNIPPPTTCWELDACPLPAWNPHPTTVIALNNFFAFGIGP